ncbi:MAG: carbohydrate-binding domain-containing protein [Clostridia bacterium]|nr:carbohydrate-binding domain-containing protein [Clostridia bacterium]
MKRKFILIISAVLCVSMLLASCQSEENNEKITTSGNAETSAAAASESVSGTQSPTGVTSVTSTGAETTSAAESKTSSAPTGTISDVTDTGSNDTDPATEKTSQTAKTSKGQTAATTASSAASVISDTYGSFTLSTSNGKFTRSGSVYNITSSGTYILSGTLNGQITVNAGEKDAVELELNGAEISCSTDSPIKLLSADKVEISAKADTKNIITDSRSAKTSDNETQGEGAIYAKTDLKIKGSGSLTVTGSYNNGIHTTKDLTIQKLTLKVTSFNNALKGNDSVTVKSGNVTAISTNGDGIKTENTDQDKNGITRGDVTVTGGTLTVYAADDGIQAAHSFEMSKDTEGNTPTVSIYTGPNSSYTASGASADSQKGVKVQNELNIKAGTINVKSYDDGLHADYGTSFTDGTKGAGTINISGGNITISVSTSTQKTSSFSNQQSGSVQTIAARPGKPGGGGGGRPGGGGFPGQQGGGGADAIHADYKLIISGGNIKIDSSYEGLEANVINVSGGFTYVNASDDGVNACSGNETPQVNVTGGYLDVTVPVNGDTDGIDSNGTYTQTGGIVITRGPGQSMSAAIDTDRGATISGGTMIALGYANIRSSGSARSYSLSLHSAGDHTVEIDGKEYTFTNNYSYSRTTVYSTVEVNQK